MTIFTLTIKIYSYLQTTNFRIQLLINSLPFVVLIGFIIGLIWALLYNFVINKFLKFKIKT